MAYQPFDPRLLRQQSIMNQYDDGSSGYEDEQDPFNMSAGGTGGDIPSSNPSIQLPTPTPMAKPQQNTLPEEDPDWKRRVELMNMLYTPSTQASDRLNKLLDEAPQRGRPSLARSIVAAGMGFGSKDVGTTLKNQEAYVNEPYNRSMAEFRDRAVPFQAAATLENQQNINERTLAGNMITAKMAEERLRASEDKTKADNASRERIAQLKYDIERSKLDGYTYTAAGGKLVGHRPDGSTFDSGLDLRDANPVEVARITAAAGQKRVETQVEGAQQRTETQGQTARDVAGTAKPQPFNIEGKPYILNDKGEAVPVRIRSDTPGGPPTPATGPLVKPGGPKTESGKTTQPNPEALKSIQSRAQETIDLIDQLMDKDGKLNPNVQAVVGTSRLLHPQIIWGTKWYTADQQIERLKNARLVELLGELKTQSKTGATGFGQLSGRELDVLEKAASMVNPGLEEGDFVAELKRVREHVKKILLPPDVYTPTTTTTTGTPGAESAADKIRRLTDPNYRRPQ